MRLMKFLDTLRTNTQKEIINKYGTKIKLIEYIGNGNVILEFDDIDKTQVHTSYHVFLNGNISSPYDKTLLGIGYTGVGKYKPSDNYRQNIQYRYWSSMISRCYSDQKLNARPTYKDCNVCKEWENYQEFSKWFDENYYTIDGESISLDKDVILKNNKIYAPDKCLFLPRRINSLFAKSNKIRGECPIGVHKFYGKYVAQCGNFHNRTTHLGLFETKDEAFFAYKAQKEKIIKQIANDYKEKIPEKVFNALMNYEVSIDD